MPRTQTLLRPPDELNRPGGQPRRWMTCFTAWLTSSTNVDAVSRAAHREGMTTVTTDAVAAVQQLRDDRDRLLGLLADVLAGHVQTSRDDVALVQVPAEVLAEIRAALETAVR